MVHGLAESVLEGMSGDIPVLASMAERMGLEPTASGVTGRRYKPT